MHLVADELCGKRDALVLCKRLCEGSRTPAEPSGGELEHDEKQGNNHDEDEEQIEYATRIARRAFGAPLLHRCTSKPNQLDLHGIDAFVPRSPSVQQGRGSSE